MLSELLESLVGQEVIVTFTPSGPFMGTQPAKGKLGQVGKFFTVAMTVGDQQTGAATSGLLHFAPDTVAGVMTLSGVSLPQPQLYQS